MAVTKTRTVREIIQSAMRLGRLVNIRSSASAEEEAIVLQALQDMLKALQNEGWNVWCKAQQELSLTAGTIAYALDPVRPLKVLDARYDCGDGIEVPMVAMMREEYDVLPVKNATGTPTQFCYDRQREDAVFKIWPILATASGSEKIVLTYEREIEDAELNDEIDVPAEFYETVRYMLAVRACDELAKDAPPRVEARATEFKEMAQAFDHEGSVFMGDGEPYFTGGAYTL